MSDGVSTVRVWFTREWGRNWVGCRHGVPLSGVAPVRICDACFDAVLRKHEERADDSALASVRVAARDYPLPSLDTVADAIGGDEAAQEELRAMALRAWERAHAIAVSAGLRCANTRVVHRGDAKTGDTIQCSKFAYHDGKCSFPATTGIPVTTAGSRIRDDCPGPANREGHHGGDPDCICYDPASERKGGS